MEKSKVTLNNTQIIQGISQNYPSDYCVIIWDVDEMDIYRFDDKEEASECKKKKAKQDSNSLDFIYLLKDGEILE